MTNLRFPRAEKLKSRRQIAKVFSQGEGLFKYPIKAIVLRSKESYSPHKVQVAFSVPKKKIKKAVHRNLIKRRIKESFRLNRKAYLSSFQEEENTNYLSILFIYQSKELLDYKSIEKSIINLLERMVKMKPESDK